MKKQLALALAATAAAVAGGLRLVQELVHRDDPAPEGAPATTPPPAGTPGVSKPATSSAPPVRDLTKSSKSELYEVATGMGIAGRSKMSKSELIEAIEAAS